MKVLSLFDGCGMTYQALKNLNVKVEKYYSSEIDKYAAKISKKNHPDIIELGDVTEWRNWNIEKPDLIVAGSPCQGFSFAGKGLNFQDSKSRLFFEFVNILNYYKPKYFLLENVKMKKEYQDTISDILGVEPVFINSALVSAQNRQRLYWCNWLVDQPKDQEIVLKDILETEENSNYVFMSDKFINRNSKAGCLVDKTKLKASNLSAMEYVKNGRQGDYLACNKFGKPIQINPAKNCNGQQPYIQDRVFHIEGKSHALTASFASRTKVGNDHISYRKLSPIECERLQTLPDDYTRGVSNTQRYKMIGNGFTVKVIEHILKKILDQAPQKSLEKPEYKRNSLFSN